MTKLTLESEPNSMLAKKFSDDLYYNTGVKDEREAYMSFPCVVPDNNLTNTC